MDSTSYNNIYMEEEEEEEGNECNDCVHPWTASLYKDRLNHFPQKEVQSKFSRNLKYQNAGYLESSKDLSNTSSKCSQSKQVGPSKM